MNSFPPRLASCTLVLLALCSLSRVNVADSSPASPRPPSAQELLSRLPLSFEANEGQFAPEVKFLSGGPGYGLALTSEGAILSWAKPLERSQGAVSREANERGAPAPFVHETVRTERILMKIIGAEPAATVRGKDPLPGESYYFLGNDPAKWRTGIRHFGKVEFKAVYPGVDLVFYGNQGQLEFDFVVAPGVDPGCIALGFEGTTSIQLAHDGHLVLSAGDEQVVLRKPIVFQHRNGQRVPVSGEFAQLGSNSVRFALGSFDPKIALVIDPVLSFSSYVGGPAVGTAVDDGGNVYVASSTFQAGLLTTPGVLLPQKTGNEADVFVMKFDPVSATVLYATYLGGTGADLASGLAIDAQGNAIVSGWTLSSNFPPVNAVQGQLAGPADAFIAKLDPSGSRLIYSTYLGGKPRFEMEPLEIDFGQVTHPQTKDAQITIRNTGTVPFDVCAGTAGTVTFFGTTASCLIGSENEFVNFSAKITVPANSQASFTIRFNSDRVGRGHDKGAISFHNGDQGIFAELPWKGEVLRTGFPADPPPPPDEETYRNKPPLFYVSGDGEDYGLAVAVDTAGNAYLAGRTVSANFPAPNSAQPFAGGSDAFVTKFSPDGAIAFSTSYGGSGGDEARAIAVDSAGNSYIAGATSSPNFPSTGALQPFPSENGYVLKMTPGGASAFSTLIGASVRGIAVDGSGAIYLTGSGGGAGLPTPGAFQTDFGGGQDAFAAKLDSNGSSLIYFTRLGGSADDEGISIAVDASGSAFVTGNTQSPNFPLKDPLQATFGGGEDFVFRGDAFLTQLSADASTPIFSTYLGGPRGDSGTAVALEKSGKIVVAGITGGDFSLTKSLPGWSNPTGGFVVMLGSAGATEEIQVWQMMEVPLAAGRNPGLASIGLASSPANFRVTFSRNVGGVRIDADAEILEVTGGVIRFRVPVDLLGPSDVPAPPTGVDPNVTLEVFSRPDGRLLVRRVGLILRFPQPVIVDELDVRLDPASIRKILQFVLGAPFPRNHTFVFLGRSGDGVAGLRVLNTALRFPQPLRFENDDVVVFEPNPATGRFRRINTPFHIPNLGSGNQGLQFNVSQNGMYVIALEASTGSPGPFPARYQLHLAANVGLPQRMINGVSEHPRGTRLDTLFNHPAPRTEGLFPGTIGVARSALFKFANVAGISQFAQAVLIPPPGGFTFGTRIVRATDPVTPIGITTPTARTPENAAPILGTVIDFTQIPIPESVARPPAPTLSETIGAVLGANDGNSVTLPKVLAGNVTVSDLILDLGSGHEIVDGTGADLEVLASAGSYRLRFGNTPYADSFAPELGPFSGVQQIDLAASGLTSARYVWVIASPTVVLDAVRSLNLLADETSPTLGPLTHVKSATITVRRAKPVANLLDPFVQLIAPNADLFGENEAGFGDDLSPDLSDAALVNLALPQDGFYRFLVKGYDKQPDDQSSGTFFTRLETGGTYDPAEIALSPLNEEETIAQKSGSISSTRQRDSFLFATPPGTTLSIVVNSKGAPPEFDPVVELYDPEDFLIGANDNRGGSHGRNAALLNFQLPATLQSGGNAPNPSTYRIVVSVVDRFGAPSPLTVGNAHVRQANAGNYELKVFTGSPTGSTPPPRIDTVNPTSGPTGARVTLTGANFGSSPSANMVRFGDRQATVSSATPTQIETEVPAGLSPGALAVTVTVAGRTSVPASFSVLSSPVTSQPRTASAHLYSESLRFRRATASANGQTYTLDLSSLPGEAPNGELYPTFDPVGGSHSGFFILTGPTFPDGLAGDVLLQAPVSEDSNQNTIPDFYEIGLAVTASTAGDYTTDLDEGTIQAHWSRVAGSATGICRLLLTSDVLGALPEFTATFELVDYSGTFRYTPGATRVNGTLELAQTGSPANTLKGLLALEKEPADPFNELSFNAGKLTNALNQPLAYFPAFLTRASATTPSYFAPISFQDGDLSTPGEDYLDWSLIITDLNDADADRVPDLSDTPSSAPDPLEVALTFDRGTQTLRFSVNGPPGATVDLEETASLVRPVWTTRSSVTLGAAGPGLQLPVSNASTRFYRARLR